MSIKRSSIILFVVFLTIVQLACNISADSATPDTFATLNGLYTASALTLEAGPTQTSLTATPGLPLPTYSPGPPPTGLPPATATNPPVYASPVPVSKCDAIQFISDVTYPDGSPVARNTTFKKTWRLKNVGTCSWTTSYALVFVGGYSIGGPSAVALTQNVNPGGTVDLSVTLTAPGNGGTYRSYWKLRNADGVRFGFGEDAEDAFWVDIKVPEAAYMAYSFVANYCDANWGNESNVLPCPGTEGDPNGFVKKLDKPVTEDGVTQDVPGLLTVPQDIKNGIIGGQYPAFTVQAGDRFHTAVNCQYNSKKCNVIFQLDYQNNGKIKTLASWNEVYEGEYYLVDLDLSALAGETVKFILVVSANGGQNNDNAIWLNPHILRQGVPPPTSAPTLTPTATATFTPTATATATPTP